MPLTEDEEARLTAAKDGIAAEMKHWCYRYNLKADELLALCAFITGIVAAHQDRNTMTEEQAKNVIIRNIRAGNETAAQNIERHRSQ